MATTTARRLDTDPPDQTHVRAHVRDGAPTVAAVWNGPTHTRQLPARALRGPIPDQGWTDTLDLLGYARVGPWVWADDRRLWWAEVRAR